MKHISQNTIFSVYRAAGIDTAIVLFFLALEFGRGMRITTPDSMLMAVTMAMVLTLPYFLPSLDEQPSFGSWIASRGALMMAGVLLGAALPVSLKFLPMIFLIATSAVSCYVQFYGLMRLHLAK